MRFPVLRVLFPLLLIAGMCVPSAAERTLIRLILKDGSYQIATKYEIQGDRVHYFSAERSEWEDVPASMVDWDAMKKWQQEHADHPQSTNMVRQTDAMQQPSAEERAAHEKEVAMHPEVAPGIKLPEGGGIFVYDVYRDKPELIALVANGSEVKPQTAKNILRATVNPLARPRGSIELPGAHARIQLHIPDPAIFMSVDDAEAPITPAALADIEKRFRIVRVSVTKKAKRIVGVAKMGASGQVSEKEDFVPSKAEMFHGGYWLRFSATVPLVPGQYALVEMVGDNQINIDDIFDFGVNSAAPENRDTLHPIVQGSGATAQATQQPPAGK